MACGLTSGLVGARADGGDFAGDLGAGGDLAANVVEDFVGVVVLGGVHPGAGFDAGDGFASAGEGEDGEAPSGPQAYDGDIYGVEVDGHGPETILTRTFSVTTIARYMRRRLREEESRANG